MNVSWGDQSRLQVAKDRLIKNVNELRGTPNLEIALRVYGHQVPITNDFQDCSDTKLEVEFAGNNFDRVINRVRTIRAQGTTPIARSLEAAAADFPDNISRNIIILITDGLEACDNDPCVIAQKLKDKGVKVTPFVIGIGLDLSYLEKFKCIGEYADAQTPASFEKVLNGVVNKALANTTAQINLNNIQGLPKETFVTVLLYEAGTSNLKYSLNHTINAANNPDTIFIDPSHMYDVVVNTIPKREKKNVAIYRNIHNVIEIDVPQGYIEVRMSNANRSYAIASRVMEQGNPQTLNVQLLGSTDKYIVGKYDIEVLTLPRSYYTVEVNQSSTTRVDVVAPGWFNYKKSKAVSAQIFLIPPIGKLEWVCNLDDLGNGGTFNLQPGHYKVVYRHKDMKNTMYTLEKDFRIYSNKTTSLNF